MKTLEDKMYDASVAKSDAMRRLAMERKELADLRQRMEWRAESVRKLEVELVIADQAERTVLAEKAALEGPAAVLLGISR